MDVDLMLSRHIQLFMQLGGLRETPVTSNMCWQDPQGETVLQYYDSRLHLSYGWYLSDAERGSTLLHLGLERWHPAAFLGVVQRLYQLKRAMVITCAVPVDSDAQFWLRLHQRQRKFMEGLCVQR